MVGGLPLPPWGRHPGPLKVKCIYVSPAGGGRGLTKLEKNDEWLLSLCLRLGCGRHCGPGFPPTGRLPGQALLGQEEGWAPGVGPAGRLLPRGPRECSEQGRGAPHTRWPGPGASGSRRGGEKVPMARGCRWKWPQVCEPGRPATKIRVTFGSAPEHSPKCPATFGIAQLGICQPPVPPHSRFVSKMMTGAAWPSALPKGQF